MHPTNSAPTTIFCPCILTTRHLGHATAVSTLPVLLRGVSMARRRRGKRAKAVRSRESAGATNAMQTPSPARKSRRIAARHDGSAAKNGDADGAIDVPRPSNASTDAAVEADTSREEAEASVCAATPVEVAGSPAAKPRKFPSASPKKRKDGQQGATPDTPAPSYASAQGSRRRTGRCAIGLVGLE